MRRLKIFTAVLTVCALAALGAPAAATPTGGSGGPLTDTTFNSYTSGGITSSYHLYAAGLDWSKKVGLLVYADGSGEYGLKNPSSTYLLAGTNGMINVAKRQNMVLLTPLAPGVGCPDGGGTCWYQTSSGYSPAQKAAWSHALVEYVKTRYNVDTTRVALGGYSSGAQWLTEYFAPAWGSVTMDDGVAVAISYGGSPKVTTAFTAGYKANVVHVWDVGDQDPSWTTTSQYGVKAGKAWYDANGFTTQLTLVPGEDHSRSGQFGPIMEREIIENVLPSTTTGPDTTPPTTPGTPSASSITSTGATLNWAASTDNVGVTGYDVLDSSDAVIASSATNSATLTGLTANTSYTVRVRAVDAAGNQSSTSPPVTFTTAATAWTVNVSPTQTGGRFDIYVPSGYSGPVYIRLGLGNYKYQPNVTGPTWTYVTFSSQPCGTTQTWTLYAPDGTYRNDGMLTTLPCALACT